MVPSNPENVDSGILQVGKGSQCAEAPSWYDSLPLEPEIEKISVDNERRRIACQASEKTDERSLDLRTGNAEMRVGDYVAGRL